MKIITCQKCGITFSVSPSRTTKFCSWNCAWNNKKSKDCKGCGKKMMVYPSLMDRKNYCSKTCQYKNQLSDEVKDKISTTLTKRFGGNASFKSLQGMYKWRSWSKRVKERDNYTCQNCGGTKNLISHHIKYANKYPKLRYDISNGITLCRSCHPKIHKL